MPSIIESFLVTIGLDGSGFKKEAAELQKAEREAKDTATRQGRDLEAGQRKQREAFRATKADLVGLIGLAVGATAAVAGLTLQMSKGDAATGRLAKNMGIATEELSTWQYVLKRVGGSAEDANNDLGVLTSAFQEIQLTGQSRLIPFLQLLGIQLGDLSDPTGTLLKIADAFSKMDPRRSAAIGAAMGFSPAMIATLQEGRGEVERLIDAQQRLGVLTEEQARKAQAQEKALADLLAKWDDLKRMLVENVAPVLTDVMGRILAISQDKTLLAFLDAAGTAFVALGNLAKGAFTLIGGLLRGIAQLLSGDFSGAWRTAKETVTGTLRNIIDFLKDGWQAAVKFWKALRGDVDDPAAPATPPAGTRPAPNARAGGGRIPANKQARFDEVVRFFQMRGYSLEAARGIAAGIWAESRFDEAAFNPAGGGKGAYGIGQWRGQRQRELFRQYGPRPTFGQQLQYMEWELRGGNGEGGAGREIRQARTDREALELYIRRFMRPAVGPETTGDLQRGGAILGARPISNRQSSVTIGNVTVVTQATDARGIARAIGPELQAAVPQANLGLA